MEKIINNIKSEDFYIYILEERLTLINQEIEQTDNILDRYGDYNKIKVKSQNIRITTLNKKFDNLLNNQSSIKKELKQRKLYRFKLLAEYDYYNEMITVKEN